MNTLTEYAYLSTDMMVKGIAHTIIKDCPLFEKLPFEDVVGNSVKYNMETVEAGAQFYAVGEQWAESAPTFEQRSVALTILGGDADVDNYVKQTRSNVMDAEAEIIALKAKAVRDRFLKELILGHTTTTYDANGFKGLLRLLAECESSSTTDLDAPNNSQVYCPAASLGTTMVLNHIDNILALVKGGKADYLMMSSRSLIKLTGLCRAGGANLTFVSTKLGELVPSYNGVLILVNDFITDNWSDVDASSVLAIASDVQTQTRDSTNDNSPIFAFRVGGDGLVGLWNGGIMTEQIGNLETKDASRTRIKMYAAIKLGNIRAASVGIGITDGL